MGSTIWSLNKRQGRTSSSPFPATFLRFFQSSSSSEILGFHSTLSKKSPSLLPSLSFSFGPFSKLKMHGGQTLAEDSNRMSSILTASKTVNAPPCSRFLCGLTDPLICFLSLFFRCRNFDFRIGCSSELKKFRFCSSPFRRFLLRSRSLAFCDSLVSLKLYRFDSVFIYDVPFSSFVFGFTYKSGLVSPFSFMCAEFSPVLVIFNFLSFS